MRNSSKYISFHWTICIFGNRLFTNSVLHRLWNLSRKESVTAPVMKHISWWRIGHWTNSTTACIGLIGPMNRTLVNLVSDILVNVSLLFGVTSIELVPSSDYKMFSLKKFEHPASNTTFLFYIANATPT